MIGRHKLYRALAGVSLVGALLIAGPAPAAAAALEFTYKLILKHGVVGTMQMGTQVVNVTSVDANSASYDVDTRMSIDFTPFIFNHVKVAQATREVWRNGQIVAFESQTNDRGDEFHVVVEQNGNGLAVKAGQKMHQAAPGAVPTSYWYEPLFKERSQFFDIKTGDLRDVQLEYVGPAEVKYRGGQLPVRHYRMAGDPKQRQFWYFETGIMYMTRWEEDGGGTVTYVLQ
jgi:hypothetical protein